MDHVNPLDLIVRYASRGDGRRVVGGIVQNLDFQPFAGVVQRGHGVDQPADDLPLVVDRQLDRNERQVVR